MMARGKGSMEAMGAVLVPGRAEGPVGEYFEADAWRIRMRLMDQCGHMRHSTAYLRQKIEMRAKTKTKSRHLDKSQGEDRQG